MPELDHLSWHYEFRWYDGSRLREMRRVPVDWDAPMRIAFQEANWECSCAVAEVEGRPDARAYTATFHVVSGHAVEVSVSLCVDFEEWSRDNYLVMPAAAYNGNRFESRHFDYPPMLDRPEEIGPNVPTIITDVPRLNIHEGPSRIQLLAGDMATPSVGAQIPNRGIGYWLLTPQRESWGEYGFTVEENDDRSRATVRLTVPGVREEYRYFMSTTTHPSEDRGVAVSAGDTITVTAQLYTFPCADIPALFTRFKEIRKDVLAPKPLKHDLPFSAMWAIQEDKHNRENWIDSHHYFSVALPNDGIDVPYGCWQIGWVGGGMVTHPMLMLGDTQSRERALRNLDFIFTVAQTPSGFFRGMGKHLPDGTMRWYSDGFEKPHTDKWHLIRKSSDALYFLIKQFMLLQTQDSAWQLPDAWATGARRCADAFVTLWRTWGQFGQFINFETGDVEVGGSTSASTAPGGLALAGQFFNAPEYLRVAEESAAYLYDTFVQAGYTTGGPGEICQGPDSESAFGLLESLIVLYEVTGDTIWIDRARDMANQCLTWCVSYDFQYRPGTEYDRLDMRTTGSVFANVQNKHSAPGICTLSGLSLLKLYRATGDLHYLELLQEMAHNITQYLSREDRTLGNMPAGWMSERVNISDWLEPLGESVDMSTWPEVSAMLTVAEVPGLYVQTDTGFLCAFDHIDASVDEEDAEKIRVRITNPTNYPATVSILTEQSSDMAKPLGENALLDAQRVTIAPGDSQLLTFPRYEAVGTRE